MPIGGQHWMQIDSVIASGVMLTPWLFRFQPRQGTLLYCRNRTISGIPVLHFTASHQAHVVRPFRPHHVSAKGAPFTKAPMPGADCRRRHSFHLAMRSERVIDPTFSCPEPSPAARCVIDTSSVSPDRAETTAR